MTGIFLAAFDELRVHRLRSALAILSIVVGIASLTLIVSVGQLGRSAAVAVLERQTGRAATLMISAQVEPGSPLTERDVQRQVRGIAGNRALAASLVSAGDTAIEHGGQAYPLQLFGVEPDMLVIRRLRVLDGRWLAMDDDEGFAPTVVLNRRLAADLASNLAADSTTPYQIDLGMPVVIRIVGVVDDGLSTATAYSPIRALDRWLMQSPKVRQQMWVSESTAGRLDELRAAVSHLAAIVTIDRVDDPETVGGIVTIVQVVLAVVAGLSLISGAIGIANLGLATVRYRAREFALRRSFGASRRAIFGLVLLESFLLVVGAGVIGIALSWLGTVALSLTVSGILAADEIPSFPLEAAAGALAVSSVLGVLTSLAPAHAATRGEIIRAIRD